MVMREMEDLGQRVSAHLAPQPDVADLMNAEVGPDQPIAVFHVWGEVVHGEPRAPRPPLPPSAARPARTAAPTTDQRGMQFQAAQDDLARRQEALAARGSTILACLAEEKGRVIDLRADEVKKLGRQTLRRKRLARSS